MTHFQPLYELWDANLETSRRMEALALEAGATVLRMQTDAAQALVPNGSEPLLASSSTTAEERHVSERLVTCRDIVNRATEATRIWAEAAGEAKAELSRIAVIQSAASGQSLIAAWLYAARAGEELSAVTERHHNGIAQGRTSRST